MSSLYIYTHYSSSEPAVDAYRENGVMVTAIQLIQQNQFTFDFLLAQKHINTVHNWTHNVTPNKFYFEIWKYIYIYLRGIDGKK